MIGQWTFCTSSTVGNIGVKTVLVVQAAVQHDSKVQCGGAYTGEPEKAIGLQRQLGQLYDVAIAHLVAAVFHSATASQSCLNTEALAGYQLLPRKAIDD